MQFQIYTKSEAYALIAELVRKFEEFLPHYKSGTYNETQTRIEFVNPFFRALNWDINNEQNFAPFRKEVVHEALLRKGTTMYYPDYLFRREENRNFFCLETKRPSVNLKDDKPSAFQLRGYGWQLELSVSILTNFEEFAVYQCKTSVKEEKDDAKTARLEYLTYKDYLKKFDFIWETFEKNQVMQGSLSRYIQSQKGINNRETVSVKFLEQLEKWRIYLATSLITRNPEIDEFEINYAVQQTINRLLFLKIAEDRNIEPKNQLKECGKKGNIYENIYELFITADQRYNSGLFDFKKDTITKNLKIDNKVFRNIIEDLYSKNGFNFAIIPIEILGYAYEQFLGSIIVITPNRSVAVEVKPEVRKAGGVYYTPQYIVDYIVEQTIGKAIAQQTPEQIAQLKILDPSCGSGSFLLGTYHFLLNHHETYYRKQKESGKKVKELTPDDRLTSAVKKQILLNNIFGVDIDTQAVEVAKLSLLIKCLEGETPASVKEQNQLIKERVLPSLDHNVLDGNSLISHDFYENSLFLTPKEKRKINTFDWKQGFPAVIKQGGFDFVIGNPPYFSLDTLPTEQKDYLEKKFADFATRQSNIYFFFMAMAHKLLKTNGILSMINERYYFNSKNAFSFRKFMQTHYQIKEIVDFKNIQIFEGVNTLTVINTFVKSNTPQPIQVMQFGEELRAIPDKKLLGNTIATTYTVAPDSLHPENWIFANQAHKNLQEKLANFPVLSQLVEMGQGIKSGLNEVFVVDEAIVKKYKLEKSLLRKYVKTKDIQPFHIAYRGLYLLLILNDTPIHTFKNTMKYLANFKEQLEVRYQFKDKVCEWYALSIPQNLHLFQTAKEKILTPLYAKGNKFAYDSCQDHQNFYTLTDTFILVKKEEVPLALKFILGILNSKFMNFYNTLVGKLKRDGYYEYSRNTLSQLPIPPIDFNNKKQKNLHDKIVQYVEKVLVLKTEYHTAQLPTEKQRIGRETLYFLEKIDELVFELYGVEEREIA
jgi:predicted type IV restriction endonuclease